MELPEPERAVDVARDATDEAVRGLSDLPADLTLLLVGMASIVGDTGSCGLRLWGAHMVGRSITHPREERHGSAST